jgi:tetratricopeptide (TPR) repeat protein
LSEHVTKGGHAEEAGDGFSVEPIEKLGERSAAVGQPPATARVRRKPGPRSKGSPLIKQEIEPEPLLEVPLQAHSLARLSARELALYRRARFLLSSGEGVGSLLRANVPLAGLGVYEALLAQSWAARFNNPETMVRLAEAANEVAQRLSPLGYGAKRIADFQARAWGELANAYRVIDRLRSSQRTFGQAYAAMQEGTGDPYLRARLFDLEASLLGKWREFPLALTRLKSLSNIYQELGEPHLAGRAFIIRALYTFYSGKPEEAILHNQEGVNLIDRQRDPALFMHALHNHLVFLVDLRQFGPAKRALFENRQHLIYKDYVSALKLRGTEGRISYGLGELLSAESAFRDAKEGFCKTSLVFAAAIACLDLAMVLMSLNRTKEALNEVIMARETFLSLEVYREYLGSVVFLEEAFRRNEITAKLIEDTTDLIQRKWLQMGPPRML